MVFDVATLEYYSILLIFAKVVIFVFSSFPDHDDEDVVVEDVEVDDEVDDEVLVALTVVEDDMEVLVLVLVLEAEEVDEDVVDVELLLVFPTIETPIYDW